MCVCVCLQACVHLPRGSEQCNEEVGCYRGDIKMCGAPGHVVQNKRFAVCVNVPIVRSCIHTTPPCLPVSLRPILIFIENQRDSKGVWHQIKAMACPWVNQRVSVRCCVLHCCDLLIKVDSTFAVGVCEVLIRPWVLWSTVSHVKIPSQLLVRHSVDEEKRFSALCECVHVWP